MDWNKKLENSEEKYKDLIEFTNTGYLIMDTTLTILECNQKFANIVGKNSLGMIIGQNLREWVYINDIKKFDDAFKKLIKDKMGINNLEISFVNKEDQLTPTRIVSNIVENGNDRIICLIRGMMEEKIGKDIERIRSQKKTDKLLQKVREIRSDLRKIT